ncbi:MAG: class I SAM-dependent methyltransferase [Anaerolineales bacterium]|nr:class I SAM-dependent methyltransferase [Anaerolineales bacterium]
MPIELDPEGHETKALLAYLGPLRGLRLLEIGCGDGRLTWRYARLAARVVGIDPHRGKIARARQDRPLKLRRKVTFQPLELEQYAEFWARRPRPRPFDRAILAWPLRQIPAEGMLYALKTIRSLLRPGGLLVDIHPTGDPPPIELLCDGQRHLLGYLQETDNFIEYGQADVALSKADKRGLFAPDWQGTYPFASYFDTAAALRQWLAEYWGDAIFDPAIEARQQALLADQPPASPPRVILREQVRITRLVAQ